MSKGKILRDLVNERLTAAADEIFALFERTIAEYEEELCFYKGETLRKQQLLDSILNPKVVLVHERVQIPSTSSGLNQEITENPHIKEEPEEQSIKEEEEELPEPVPVSSDVCVKSEESAQEGAFICPKQHFFSHTQENTQHSSDSNDDDWTRPFSCSDAEMETEFDEGNCTQDQTRDQGTSETFATEKNRDRPTDTDREEEKKHQCSLYQKRFESQAPIQSHKRVHTGKKPYSCSICSAAFAHNSALASHRRVHTGEKPFRCSICNKYFSERYNLTTHLRIHTGEKPYSCSFCPKQFRFASGYQTHMRMHTGEKPYCCSLCNEAFKLLRDLKKHLATHSGANITAVYTVQKEKLNEHLKRK